MLYGWRQDLYMLSRNHLGVVRMLNGSKLDLYGLNREQLGIVRMLFGSRQDLYRLGREHSGVAIHWSRTCGLFFRSSVIQDDFRDALFGFRRGLHKKGQDQFKFREEYYGPRQPSSMFRSVLWNLRGIVQEVSHSLFTIHALMVRRYRANMSATRASCLSFHVRNQPKNP